MTKRIQPDMICRIVNEPVNSNRLVRTVEYCCARCDKWAVEALQSLEGRLYIEGIPTDMQAACPAGSLALIPEKYLAPLPGDEDKREDEMVKRLGKAPLVMTLPKQAVLSGGTRDDN